MVRPAGSDAPFVEVELVGGGSSGFLPLSPASDVRDQAPDLSDQEVAYRTGPDQPFQVMRGQERHEAISAAIMRGLIARYHMTNDVETVTVRAGRDPSQFTTQNEDGTHRLNLGDLVFPTVTATSYDIGEFGVSNTMTFRIAPAPGRVVRRARLVPGDQPAFGFGAGGGGGVITERSSEFRMTSIQMSPAIRALADGMFVRDDAGPDPRPDRSVGGGSVIMAPGGWSSTRYGPSWSEG